MAKKFSRELKGKAIASAPSAPTPTPTPTYTYPPIAKPFHGASSSSASLTSPPILLGGDKSAAAVAFLEPYLSGTEPSSSPFLVPPGGSHTAVWDSVVLRILDLLEEDRREDAHSHLYKKRESYQDLGPLLWFSFGIMAVLLKEVVNVYPLVSPPSVMVSPPSVALPESNRACNTLALLQCIASHPSTKSWFVQAQIPCFLLPFLDGSSKSRHFEYLRLSALGVIGALVKIPDDEVIRSLLSSEIMPLLLPNMESGTELSRTVATFIVEKILQSDVGLEYICCLPDRIFAVNLALGNVVISLVEKSSARLLKLVIRCYLRTSEDHRSLPVLKRFFPKRLIDGTFDDCLCENRRLIMWLQKLLDNVQVPRATQEGVVIAEGIITLRIHANIATVY